MKVTVLGTRDIELLRRVLAEAVVSWGDLDVLELAQRFQRASACLIIPLLPSCDESGEGEE